MKSILAAILILVSVGSAGAGEVNIKCGSALSAYDCLELISKATAEFKEMERLVDKPEPVRTCWEHLATATITKSDGLEGWQLVSVIRDLVDQRWYFFKRPIKCGGAE